MSVVTRAQSKKMDLGSVFNRAKAEAEALNLTGQEMISYINDVKKAEAEAEERKKKAELEAEERKKKAELEAEERKKKAEAEVEERKERLQIEKMKTEAEIMEGKIRLQAQLEKEAKDAEVERERNRARPLGDQNTNNSAADNAQGGQSRGDKYKMKLPYFEDGDDLEAYIITFERAAIVQGWSQGEWAPRLGFLLKGSARDVYTTMSHEDAGDYDKLKAALLKRFRLTAEEYRKKFREARRQPNEPAQSYANNLKLWLNRWRQLSGKESTFEDLQDLVLQEKFLEGIPYDQARFIRQSVPKNMEQAIDFAAIFESAKESTNSDHDRKRHDDRRKFASKQHDRGPQAQTSSNDDTLENKERGAKMTCFTCQGEHNQRDCPRKRNLRREFERCSAVRMLQEAVVEPSSRLTSLCEICENIPFSPECTVLVNGVQTSGLRDTGSSATIVSKELVPDSSMTGNTVDVSLAESPEKRTLATAVVKMQSPYFEGEVEVLVMDKPNAPVLIGNYRKVKDGSTVPVSVYPKRKKCNSARMRTEMKESKGTQPLTVSSSLLREVIPQDLSKAQREDPTLIRVRKLADQKRETVSKRRKRGNVTATYEWKNEILFRTSLKHGEQHHQVVVPRCYRTKVLQLAHDASAAGHLSSRKTKARIWEDHVWPGICGDVRRYCASCNFCQNSMYKCATRKVPLKERPTADTYSQRLTNNRRRSYHTDKTKKHAAWTEQREIPLVASVFITELNKKTGYYVRKDEAPHVHKSKEDLEDVSPTPTSRQKADGKVRRTNMEETKCSPTPTSKQKADGKVQRVDVKNIRFSPSSTSRQKADRKV